MGDQVGTDETALDLDAASEVELVDSGETSLDEGEEETFHDADEYGVGVNQTDDSEEVVSAPDSTEDEKYEDQAAAETEVAETFDDDDDSRVQVFSSVGVDLDQTEDECDSTHEEDGDETCVVQTGVVVAAVLLGTLVTGVEVLERSQPPEQLVTVMMLVV